MIIEVIPHHRDNVQHIIRETFVSNGVTPSHDVVEEFLSFYDYNGLTATINNLFNYCNTVTRRHEQQRQLRLVTQRCNG